MSKRLTPEKIGHIIGFIVAFTLVWFILFAFFTVPILGVFYLLSVPPAYQVDTLIMVLCITFLSVLDRSHKLFTK